MKAAFPIEDELHEFEAGQRIPPQQADCWIGKWSHLDKGAKEKKLPARARRPIAP